MWPPSLPSFGIHVAVVDPVVAHGPHTRPGVAALARASATGALPVGRGPAAGLPVHLSPILPASWPRHAPEILAAQLRGCLCHPSQPNGSGHGGTAAMDARSPTVDACCNCDAAVSSASPGRGCARPSAPKRGPSAGGGNGHDNTAAVAAEIATSSSPGGARAPTGGAGSNNAGRLLPLRIRRRGAGGLGGGGTTAGWGRNHSCWRC